MNSSSDKMGMLNFSAFRSLLGPILSPDNTNVVFLEIELTFFPPCCSTNFLSSSLEKWLKTPEITIDIPNNFDEIALLSSAISKHNPSDTCCDKIHIVYDDFNQHDDTQPYKRYKLTYYAEPLDDGTKDGVTINPRYGIFKSKISWKQDIGVETGDWVADCSECYEKELIRDYVEDMEFVALDKEGVVLNPYPSTKTEASRANLYKVRAVDIRLAFISEKPFFRFESREGSERKLKGFSRTIRSFSDRYLRDNVVVTVYTRNIVGQDIF